MAKGEAKERWCPFARVFYMPSNAGVMPPPAFNRSMSRLADGSMGTDMPPAARCVGVQCMAWRQLPSEEVSPNDPAGLQATDIRVTYDILIVGPTRRFLPGEGYCGLAGRP